MTPEEYEEFQRLGKQRPSGGPTNPEADRLYKLYAGWTGQLHFWVGKELGRHVDCEFFPEKFLFKIYGGFGQPAALDVYAFHTVPGISRPAGERTEVVRLPRPETHPSKDELDRVFRELCLAAARVLEIEVEAPKKHAFLARPKRRRIKNA